MEEQSIRVFRLRHKPDIAAKKAEFASAYGHIWSTKVENRLRVLICRLEEVEEQMELLRDHARRETETIRSVDPEASEVLVNDRVYLAYVKEQRSQLWRTDDGTAMYERIDAEGGTELLLAKQNEPILGHTIGGTAEAPGPVHDQLPVTELASDNHVSEPVAAPAPAPVSAPTAPARERDLPRSGPVRVMPPLDRAPVQESVPDVQKPVQPANVSGMTHDSALQLARTVWGSGDGAELSRTSLFVGISAQSTELWLGHASAMGWAIVDGDQIKKGPINPVPAEPVPLTGLKARMRWGPDWIG